MILGSRVPTRSWNLSMRSSIVSKVSSGPRPRFRMVAMTYLALAIIRLEISLVLVEIVNIL